MSEHEIKPGMLVVTYHGDDAHLLHRVLRTWVITDMVKSGTSNTDQIPYAELLPLVDLSTLQPVKSYNGGIYLQEVRCENLTPFEAVRREIYDDLATRIAKVQRQVRVYETTTECDPSFQMARWRWDALCAAVKKKYSDKTLNQPEIANIAYGECYPNAHLKFKAV
jgi:hypothetical protein